MHVEHPPNATCSATHLEHTRHLSIGRVSPQSNRQTHRASRAPKFRGLWQALTNRQTATRPLEAALQRVEPAWVGEVETSTTTSEVSFTNVQVSDIVKGSAARQIFAPRQRFVWKVISTAPDARWAADMIFFTSTPSKGGQRFILAAQDIWNRKIYTVALAQNNPTAVAIAFRIILREAGTTPKELNTDMGADFTSGAFPRLLNEQGIDHRTNGPRDSNAIATLDRATQTNKVSLMRTGSTDTWADRLAKVTRGQNTAPHEHLLGEAPDSVASNDQLHFHLQKQAAHNLQHNQSIVRRREQRLEESGADRIQERPRKFERSFKPIYGDTVHTLEKIEDGLAVDTDGARHNPMCVLHVPRGSTSAMSSPFSRRGSAKTEARKRAVLEPFANNVTSHLGKGNEMALWEVGEFMEKQRFSDKAREAGINMESKITSCLRAFPERFTVTTSSEGGEATVTLAG